MYLLVSEGVTVVVVVGDITVVVEMTTIVGLEVIAGVVATAFLCYQKKLNS